MKDFYNLLNTQEFYAFQSIVIIEFVLHYVLKYYYPTSSSFM